MVQYDFNEVYVEDAKMDDGLLEILIPILYLKKTSSFFLKYFQIWKV